MTTGAEVARPIRTLGIAQFTSRGTKDSNDRVRDLMRRNVHINSRVLVGWRPSFAPAPILPGHSRNKLACPRLNDPHRHGLRPSVVAKN